MQEASYQDINQVLIDIVNRIRSLESKYNILAERLLIVNQNMISQFKKNTIESKTTGSDLKELQRENFVLKETIADLTKDMGIFASKEELKVLEKYINLWDPMKFISQRDLDEALKKHGRKKK